MTRRLTLALALASAVAGSARADDRPNIVVAIADDWSWPHAGAYGDKVVRTPAFDRVAREGVLFTNAFCAAPTCTASRGALLTGQAPHRLENGADLWSVLPGRFACYPDLLEAAGYAVGLTGKGWGPGTLEGSGRKRNPAGPHVKDFPTFLRSVPAGKPFCYWFGSTDPHRPYDPGTGAAAGLNAADLAVPPYLPDTPEVRADLLDYGFEVQRFDRDLAAILRALDDAGLADDTIVVVTSDNGMPFPRCKANLYDSGTHVPLALRWPSRVKGGRTESGFVGLADLAPTFLEAAGLPVPRTMTGVSLYPDVVATPGASPPPRRDAAFTERERHANVRAGDLGYPGRALRTEAFLLIENLRPDRMPAGDPLLVHSVGPFGDIDPSPTKDLLLGRRDDPRLAPFARLALDRRPAVELYDLARDPHQVNNVAGDKAYESTLSDLRARLLRWRVATGDPLATTPPDPSGREVFDDYPYVGPPARAEKP